MSSGEEDSLVGRYAFRACCQWQPQLSKKGVFLPIMIPRECVPHNPLHCEQAGRKRSAQDSLRSWADRGTDRNRRASDDPQDAQRDRQTEQASSSTGILAIFMLCLVFQEWMVQVAITGGKSSVLPCRRSSAQPVESSFSRAPRHGTGGSVMLRADGGGEREDETAFLDGCMKGNPA